MEGKVAPRRFGKAIFAVAVVVIAVLSFVSFGTLESQAIVTEEVKYLPSDGPSESTVAVRAAVSSVVTNGLFTLLSHGSGKISPKEFEAVIPAFVHNTFTSFLKRNPMFGSSAAAERMDLHLPLLSRRLFNRADANGDGAIDAGEFDDARDAFNTNATYFIFQALNKGAHPSLLVPVHVDDVMEEAVLASVRVLRQYLEVFLIGLRERQPDVVKYILETTNGGEADRLWHAWFPVSADDLFAVAQAKASEIGFKIGLNNTAYEQAFIQYVKIANKTRSSGGMSKETFYEYLMPKPSSEDPWSNSPAARTAMLTVIDLVNLLISSYLNPAAQFRPHRLTPYRVQAIQDAIVTNPDVTEFMDILMDAVDTSKNGFVSAAEFRKFHAAFVAMKRQHEDRALRDRLQDVFLKLAAQVGLNTEMDTTGESMMNMIVANVKMVQYSALSVLSVMADQLRHVLVEDVEQFVLDVGDSDADGCLSYLEFHALFGHK